MTARQLTLDDFEKGINIPVELTYDFAIDMFQNVLYCMSDEGVEVALGHFGVGFDAEQGITSLPFKSLFSIVGYYTAAMNDVFNYHDNFAKEYAAFEAMVLADDSNNRELHYKALVRFIHNLTSPLADFFNKHQFGTDRELMNHLSLLPPVMRYVVLSEMYGILVMDMLQEKLVNASYCSNVVDKLNLAILKVSDADTAFAWIESNKNVLVALDMYEVCVNKIQALANQEVEYSTFGEAYPKYAEKWNLKANSQDRQQFEAIVKFYYEMPKLAARKIFEDIKAG